MTFAEYVREAAAKRALALPAAGHPEPLADLAYADECAVKANALRTFWSRRGLPGAPLAIVPAPRPRGYRTTTKRRASLRRGKVSLSFSADGASPPGLSASKLDGDGHHAVYAHLQDQLGRSASAAFAEALNYVIVRGSGSALCVIFNLSAFAGPLVRRAKQLGESLRRAELGVASAFLYLDPSGSDYYLEARRPSGVLSFKRLFGPEALELRIEGRKLRFPPIVFSQVNEAMLPALIAAARERVGPLAGRALLDLYCGYGLFSACLAGEASAALGVDAEGPAVEAARENVRHLGLPRVRFLAGRITGEFLKERVRPAAFPEVALLDPPRQGSDEGVIEAVARRGPERVLHIFCGTDELPRELERWRLCGYRVSSALPLDLFPGTASLETLVLLER